MIIISLVHFHNFCADLILRFWILTNGHQSSDLISTFSLSKLGVDHYLFQAGIGTFSDVFLCSHSYVFSYFFFYLNKCVLCLRPEHVFLFFSFFVGGGGSDHFL